MRYEFIGIDSKVDEDVTFGTCELCGYVADHYYSIMRFKDKNGDIIEEEVGHWEGSFYYEPWWWYRVAEDDLIHFADYIQGVDVDNLSECVNDYFTELISKRMNKGGE